MFNTIIDSVSHCSSLTSSHYMVGSRFYLNEEISLIPFWLKDSVSTSQVQTETNTP
jgi:hypothetical protein